MTLPRPLLEHKTLILAVFLIVRRIQQLLGLSPGASVTDLALQLGANRTSAYEQARRLMAVLSDLATASPGRPPKASPSTEESMRRLELRNAVLQYRVDHPGSWVQGPRGRTEYSSEMKRFVLARRDSWEGTLESFAEASGVPLDTLRDWLAEDSLEGLGAEAETAKPTFWVPIDVSEMVRRIVDSYEQWQGSLRSFVRLAPRQLGISSGQLAKVMRILGEIRQRRTRPLYRYRGETRRLVPGLVLVTDGTQIEVFLSGSGRRIQLNWQGTVDQATGCHTPAQPVVTPTEDAASVRRAYDQSLVTLAGVVPEAFLHDGKPCYQEAELVESLAQDETEPLPATPGRPQNKAICEGSFGLFEQRVGTLVLDDSSTETLVQSALSEILRAYTAASNGIPRRELKDQSPLSALRRRVPSEKQLEADRTYLRKLTARHREKPPPPDEPIRRALLDEGYERLGVVDHDPEGKQRQRIARFCTPEAIRQGLALVAARIERLDSQHPHRYLHQVIENVQDELDLERAAVELDHLNRTQAQHWMGRYEQQLNELREQRPQPERLALALAEKAAQAEIPLGGLFWKRQLLAFLDGESHLLEAVRRHLIRLFDEPLNRRLALLDTLAAWEHGLLDREHSC